MSSFFRSNRALAVTLAISVALHVGTLAWVGTMDAFAELDVEFSMPSEVEFGVSEGMIEAEAPPEPEAPAEPPPPEPETPPEPEAPAEAGDTVVDAGRPLVDAAVDAAIDGGEDAGPDAEVPDASLDAGVADAGDVDAGDAGDDAGELPSDAGGPPADASAPDLVAHGAGDAGTATSGGTSSLAGPSRLAPGSQIALRLDLAAIRASTLAPAVQRLIDGIPDFHLLLDGSGIDVMRDLDRLYMATPDPFDRSRFVYAGRHVHDEAWARTAVARLADARGEPITWTRQRGVWVAPWHNVDRTERIVALIGPQHFVICRPEDLRAVLAYMQVRLERNAATRQRTLTTTGADALLTLGPDEALAFEIEGLQQYVRRASIPMPERARATIRSTDDANVSLEAVAIFDDAETAARGEAFWNRQRQRIAENSFVRFTTFGPILANSELEQEGDSVRGGTSLAASQAEALLGLVQANLANLARMRPPPPGQPAPSPTPTP